MGATWRMEFPTEGVRGSNVPQFPEGFAWAAEVTSHGLATGERVLHVYADAERVEVRAAEGRKLWSASTVEIFGDFATAPHDTAGDSPDSPLLARDSGAEAAAMLSLGQLFEWSNAIGCLPERRTGRVLVPGEDDTFMADVDPETGLVHRVSTVPGSRHDIELRATWRLVRVTDD